MYPKPANGTRIASVIIERWRNIRSMSSFPGKEVSVVMKGMTRRVIQGVAATAIATLCIGWSATQAHAGAVISNGPVSLGIFDTGNLGFNPGTGAVGLSLAGVGDAITPGILAEGWGV